MFFNEVVGKKNKHKNRKAIWFEYKNRIIPVEVKSGRSGKMQSMNLFLNEKKHRKEFAFHSKTFRNMEKQKLFRCMPFRTLLNNLIEKLLLNFIKKPAKNC